MAGHVFDALEAGVAVLDGEARVVAWNLWLSEASGVPAEKAMGRRLDELFPDARLQRLASAVTAALQAGASSLLTHTLHPGLFPLRTRAGQELIHNVSVRPVGGPPSSNCLVQIADVSASAHRERVLRERQNARYDAVVDNAPDAIVTLDAQGVIQMANPAAAREFGRRPQELVGLPLVDLLETPESWREVWKAVSEGEILHRPTEMVARRKDGSLSYLEVSASRWMSQSRMAVSAILRDVNERRAAEEALRSLNQTLELRVAERTADRDRMWRLSTDLMLVARLDGTISAVNPAWTQLFGWAEQALVGSNILDFVVEEDRPRFLEEMAVLAGSTAPERFELRVRTRDQGRRWIEWSAVAADDLFQAVGRDVTAERDAEQALREAEEALRQAQKMEAIGQLTGGIAHDFNNLLQVVSGNLQLLGKDIAGNPDAERRVQNAMAGVMRGSKLAAQLLAFGRRQPLAPKVVNVGRFINGMHDMLRQAVGEGVEVETVIADGLWNTLLDTGNIESALLNLAINARDAMDGQGRLTVEASNFQLEADDAAAHAEVSPGEYVLIEISDTGCGMSAETAARIFEPFFTTKPEGKGTGLGLSMVYGFVKQSGGHVRVLSTLGKGTSFRLYLPRSLAEEDRLAEGETGTVLGGRETILVAEDDEAVRETVVAMLRDLGYGVHPAKDALEAMSLVEGGLAADLLFTDVIMPGPMKSTDLARRAREFLPGLKVLFTSGYTANSIVSDGRLEEGVELLRKPYTRNVLAQRLRSVLDAVAEQAVSAAPDEREAAPAADDALRILLCEDDWLIRLSATEMLQDLGHTVLEAVDAKGALLLLSREKIDLLMTDVGLPDMSGVALVERARTMVKALPVVFATGHSEVEGVTPGPAVALISKPYTARALAKVIASVWKGVAVNGA